MRRRRPTAHSLRLRSIAAQCARRLARSEACAIALTGSAARGDAVKSSDIDLWVIGRSSGSFAFPHPSVHVTLLRQRLGEALALDNLCFYEVRDIKVLHDPRGVFAQLRERFETQQAGIRKRIHGGTLAEVKRRSKLSSRGSAYQRALHLGRLAFLFAAWELFEAFGWRVPKFRNLRTYLPKTAVARVRQLLRVKISRASAEWASKTLPRLTQEAQAAFKALKIPQPSVPIAALRQLRKGPREDAVLALRAHFHEQWDPLLSGAVSARITLPMELTRYYGIVFGFEEAAPKLAQNRAVFRQLLRELPSARTLAPPALLRQLYSPK